MINREKVIKGLEKCKRCGCDDCAEKGASHAPWDCPVYDDFVDNAIVLLKEYVDQIEQLEHDLAVTQDNLNYFLAGND